MAKYKVLASFLRDKDGNEARKGDVVELTSDQVKAYEALPSDYIQEVNDKGEPVKAERSGGAEPEQGTDQQPETQHVRRSSKR